MLLFPKFMKKIKQYLSKEYFGFVNGHKYISNNQIKELEKIVGKKNQKIVTDFEKRFAKIIGSGECISYASARMGFYEIMGFINIKKGDEFIILGATCSVMINAIKRKGAIPRYSDIDINTIGSDYKTIKKLINQKTKLIIAQHSFGIPCDIKPIVDIAKQKDIFLLEDCALTLGSSYKNKKVGNFGNAAIFSTDHTKPLNTLIGGLVYSKNKLIINSLRSNHKNLGHLSKDKQKALWNQFLYEKKIRNIKNEGKIFLLNPINNLLKNYFRKIEPFLIDDYSTNFKNTYPYPAQIPSFIAAIGIIELKNWNANKKQRIKNLNRLKILYDNYNIKIPKSYKNKDLEIIPLRFVWENKNKDLSFLIDKILDSSGFWFKEPIVCSTEPLESFNYKKGMCPLSESLGKRIINIPCNLNEKDFIKLLISLEKILKTTKNDFSKEVFY